MGYSAKIADADDDEVDVFDIKNRSIEDITLNPYYMVAPNMFNAFGLKAEFDNPNNPINI